MEIIWNKKGSGLREESNRRKVGDGKTKEHCKKN